MRSSMRIITLLFLGLTMLAGQASAAGTVCYKCHARKNFRGAVVHKPVAEGRCNVCHSPHVAKEKGLLQEKVSKLCLSCHKLDREAKGALVVHKPFRNGNCLACHDPHTSKVKGLVREDRPGQVCFRCHEAELAGKKKFLHAPFKSGNCVACHSPHSSNHFLLLREDIGKLCSKCHTKGQIAASHKGFPRKPENGCLTCHNPHGANRRNLIRDVLHPPYKESCDNCHDGSSPVTTDKCLECHQDDIQKGLFSSHNHLVDPVNACVKCHSPHASDRDDLLLGRQERVCRQCHLDTFTRKEDALHPHPRDKASCKDCHAVHGSNQIAMLKGDGVKVCTRCHETQGKFTHPVGDKVHDPRTGQPLTCVSCHYPHGTNFEFNLKLNGARDLCIQCHRSY